MDAREGVQLEKLPAAPASIFARIIPSPWSSSKPATTRCCAATARRAGRIRSAKIFSVRESLRHERALMEPIRKLADVVIDTTQFNVHELRHFITERFKNPDQRPMLVSVVSFGYKYGVPTDADLVFDVRFLPNPHFVPRLREYTGSDPKVRRYIRSFPQTGEFLRRIEGLLAYLIPHYIERRKKLSDHRLRLHRRQASLRDARRSKSRRISRKARFLDQSHAPRHRKIVSEDFLRHLDAALRPPLSFFFCKFCSALLS